MPFIKMCLSYQRCKCRMFSCCTYTLTNLYCVWIPNCALQIEMFDRFYSNLSKYTTFCNCWDKIIIENNPIILNPLEMNGMEMNQKDLVFEVPKVRLHKIPLNLLQCRRTRCYGHLKSICDSLACFIIWFSIYKEICFRLFRVCCLMQKLHSLWQLSYFIK